MRRNIGSVAAGYLVITSLTALSFIVLNTLFPGELNSTFWLVFKLITAMICAFAGGYVTAAIARARARTAAFWLAGLFTLLAAISMTQPYINEPLWFQLGLLAISGPMIGLGSAMRIWQARPRAAA